MMEIADFLLEIILIIIGVIVVFIGITAQITMKRGPARNWGFIILLIAGIALIAIGVIIIVLRIVLPFILPVLGL
jgi:hypothetical protein